MPISQRKSVPSFRDGEKGWVLAVRAHQRVWTDRLPRHLSVNHGLATTGPPPPSSVNTTCKCYHSKLPLQAQIIGMVASSRLNKIVLIHSLPLGQNLRFNRCGDEFKKSGGVAMDFLSKRVWPGPNEWYVGLHD